MTSSICTLYEGHYHHGVAALSNSLYNSGFRGSVYIGYRGKLPLWSKEAKENRLLNWEGGKSLTVAEGLDLHFLPVTTKYHLTNYKPDFMLQLWDGPAKDVEGMFYFDPDIVIKCKFSFFETWIKYGVALVHEIAANDMTSNNPIRSMWKTIIDENNEKLNHEITSYINGGFFGLSKSNMHFLQMFQKFQHLAERKYNVNLHTFDMTDRTDPFFANDQDVMNIAAMCTHAPLSELGPEAMDLIQGGFTMSHAIGGPKPWRKNFLKSGISGNPPSLADKEFWNYTCFPIKTFSGNTKKQKEISIKIASFLGRFYRKY
jgi:hypothetical protein